MELRRMWQRCLQRNVIGQRIVAWLAPKTKAAPTERAALCDADGVIVEHRSRCCADARNIVTVGLRDDPLDVGQVVKAGEAYVGVHASSG